MLEIKKYAAIDIGSNAIRLLISNAIKDKNNSVSFKKSSFVRVPIRLGADAFVKEVISEQNIAKMIDTIEAFKLLMKVHNVVKFRVCATSAMREAKNGKETSDRIFAKTGVKIEIISGKEEAVIISSNDLNEVIKGNDSYLYVDVGGGSTELTVFCKGKIVGSKSFKMGTVRLLNNEKSINNKIFESVKNWTKAHTTGLKNLSLIGTGGNINKLFKMSGKLEGKPISYAYLNAQYRFLRKMSFDERISELSLNPDRADVIIPATKIFIKTMKWSNAKKIYVPRIGLSDGMIKSLSE